VEFKEGANQVTSYNPSRPVDSTEEDGGYGLFTLDLDVTGGEQQREPTISDSSDELAGLIRKASLDSLLIDLDDDGKMMKKSPSFAGLMHSNSPGGMMHRTPSNVAIDNMLAELEGGAKLPHEPFSPKKAERDANKAKISSTLKPKSSTLKRSTRTVSHDNLVAMETPNRSNGFGPQSHRPRRRYYLSSFSRRALIMHYALHTLCAHTLCTMFHQHASFLSCLIPLLPHSRAALNPQNCNISTSTISTITTCTSTTSTTSTPF
jgi:hypothetical protein